MYDIIYVFYVLRVHICSYFLLIALAPEKSQIIFNLFEFTKENDNIDNGKVFVNTICT